MPLGVLMTKEPSMYRVKLEPGSEQPTTCSNLMNIYLIPNIKVTVLDTGLQQWTKTESCLWGTHVLLMGWSGVGDINGEQPNKFYRCLRNTYSEEKSEWGVSCASWRLQFQKNCHGRRPHWEDDG